MHRCPMILVFAVVTAAPAAAAQGLRGTLIVTNKQESTASLIDIASGRTVATLPTGSGPHEVVATGDGRTAVVSDYGAQVPGGTLTVIDVAGRRVARTIVLDPYRRPHGLAFLPGDSLVAVTSETHGAVLLVRVADGALVRTLSTGGRGSHMLAVVATGATIYTGNITDGTVSEIDVAGGRRLRTFTVPAQPEAITVTPDGTEVWVGSNTTGVVSAVRTATAGVEVVATGLGWPYRILLTPDRRTVLIPDYRGNELRALDAATRAERGRVRFTTGPQGITLAPDGRTAYLSLTGEDRVAIIEVDSLHVRGYLGTGTGPDGVAYSILELR